ncbi:MAG: hypothetical protein K2X27_06160 [Candidatus Obscuribacterales bacterium]|nr:hypothetical protein [Candidatus Obscuribacterales bacterium]
MPSKSEIDLLSLAELHWHKMGQASLSGSLLELFRKLDARFQDFAKKYKPEEYFFPPFISASQMAKLDYFKSFPHLLTIPVTLDEEKDNLLEFAGAPLREDGSLQLGKVQAVKEVLTPAACYHFYDELEGSKFTSCKFFTTRCVCYRREKQYLPLQRQWAFSMREFVCIGSLEEVQNYLAEFEAALAVYFKEMEFPVNFEFATDPFFNPSANPKYLLQKLEPVKKEMIYDGKLSIGSLNFHRNFFGETFSLSHNDTPAYSACVAFGLERWIYMILNERGLDSNKWRI